MRTGFWDFGKEISKYVYVYSQIMQKYYDRDCLSDMGVAVVVLRQVCIRLYGLAALQQIFS